MKHTNDGCCETITGRLGSAEIERLKSENAELRAMVDELRALLVHTIEHWDNDDDPTELHSFVAELNSMLDKTPTQSLEDYGMRVAEAVRHACDKAAYPIVRQYTTSTGEVSDAFDNIDLAPIVKGVE